MAWDTSRRRDQLPPNWQDLRRQTRTRADGICEHTDNGVRCTSLGTDCHHTGRNDDHRLEALQWLCRPHHDIETRRQSREAWNRRYIEAKKRDPEAHPGLL